MIWEDYNMNTTEVIDKAGGLEFIKKSRLKGKTQRETAEELGYNNPKIIYNYLKKYDLMGENSQLPKEKDEVILILDEYNRVDDKTREMLGLDKSKSYSFHFQNLAYPNLDE